jgi:hypothetical protein
MIGTTHCQLTSNVGSKHGHLLSSDLGPTGVVADQSNDRRVVALEGVEFSNAVAGGAVTPQDPHLRLRSTQFGTKGKSTANTQSSERARVEPLQRPTGSEIRSVKLATNFQRHRGTKIT